MERIVNPMDNFSTHWGAIRRRYPMAFPLQTLGYMPRKTDWVRSVFATCNFSFIVSGGGTFIRNGTAWRVETPCVITQWPGDRLEYGPAEGFAHWEELYLIFRAETRRALEACGFIREDRPVWRMARGSQWKDVLEEVVRLGQSPSEKSADRMDRLCERLVLESLLHESAPAGESLHAEGIRAIQAILRREPARLPDFSELARAQGMSDSTFRRQWARLVGPPPARYLTELRIREACRQLVETTRTVGEIAAAVGFEDALYFSRKFRQHARSSPTEYRRTYSAEAAGA